MKLRDLRSPSRFPSPQNLFSNIIEPDPILQPLNDKIRKESTPHSYGSIQNEPQPKRPGTNV